MGFRRKLLRCDSALVEFTVVSCWRRGKLNEPMRRDPQRVGSFISISQLLA